MKTKTKKVIKKVKSLAEIPALLGKDIPLETIPETIIEPEEEVTNINNCEYYLEMSFNGEVLKAYTNNLKISILSFGREVVTEMFIKISKGSSDFEKKLTLIQGKKLFNDMQTLDIFLDTFYSLYGQPLNAPRTY